MAVLVLFIFLEGGFCAIEFLGMDSSNHIVVGKYFIVRASAGIQSVLGHNST